MRWRVLTVPVLLMGMLAFISPSVAAAELPRVVPGLGSVQEVDSGSVVLEVPVTLSAPSTDTVTVQWTTLFGPGVTPPNPAEPGIDFVAASGSTTFIPGDTDEIVNITVNGDTDFEPDDYIVVLFNNPSNAVMGGFYGLGFGINENNDPPPPRTLTIVPAAGLNGGDMVTVEGTGWTPGATIAICQGADGTSVDPPQGACLADNAPLAMFPADGTGAFSVEAEARRWGYVPGLDAFVDCTSPSPGCAFGAAEVADVGGTITAAPISFAAPPPPPTTGGTLVVSPSTDVLDGDTVLVSGSDFRPNQPIDIYQCIVEPNLAGPQGCAWATRVRSTTDVAGSFSSPFDVARTAQGFDCTTGTMTCYLAAAEAIDFEGTYVAETITFAPPALLVPGQFSGAEGDTGNTTFTVPVGLSEPASEIVTFHWETVVLGSPQPEATPGDDYAAASGTVTFTPGQVDSDLAITVFGDLDFEPDEVVWIQFSDPVNARIGPNSLGTATILNEDDNTIPILDPFADVWPEPETAEAYPIAFDLSEPSLKTISVQWETVVLGSNSPSPEATPVEDYAPTSGTAVVPPGSTAEGDLTITVFGDTIPEPEEVVWIRFFNPVNALLGTDNCLAVSSPDGCIVALYIGD